MAKIREDLSTPHRVYVETRYGEEVVSRLKDLGAHWDRETKCWWLGRAKRPAVEALLRDGGSLDLRDPLERSARADQLEEQGREAEAAAVRAPPKEDLDAARVYAQVEYKGRRYYVVAEQRDRETREPLRCRLTTLDGLPGGPHWVDCPACTLIRTYEGREVWDGRRYSGKTVMRYPTVGSLRAFRDRQRDPATRRGVCSECGAHGPAGEPCSECGGEGSYL